MSTSETLPTREKYVANFMSYRIKLLVFTPKSAYTTLTLTLTYDGSLYALQIIYVRSFVCSLWTQRLTVAFHLVIS
jgi:hypothetical protein